MKVRAKVILAIIVLASSILMAASALGDSPDPTSQNFLNIGLTASLIVATYLWASRLLGNFWALIPAALASFSPIFLGFGHLAEPLIIKPILFVILAYSLTGIFLEFKTSLTRKNYWKIFIYGFCLTAIGFLFFYHQGYGNIQNLLNYDNWVALLKDYSLKESLPTLILILIAGLSALRNILAKAITLKKSLLNYLSLNPTEFVMIALVFVYIILVVAQGKPDLHYTFAALPIIYILAASGIKNFVQNDLKAMKAKIMISQILVLWVALNSIVSFPNYVSFLNELAYFDYKAGYMVNGKYDYGTDLKRLDAWAKIQGNTKIGLDYSGEAVSENKYIPWQSSFSAPDEVGLEYLAVSTRKLYEAKRKLKPGEMRDPEEEYLWLDIDNPIEKIGSIWVYNLTTTQ